MEFRSAKGRTTNDVSGAYVQPVNTNVKPRPQHTPVPLSSLKEQTLTMLSEIVEEIRKAGKEFAEWRETITPEQHEAKARWQSKRPERTGAVNDGFTEWQKSNPEILALPSVKCAQKRVSELKTLLAEAQSELDIAVAIGSPRQGYVRAIISAGSRIAGLAQSLHRAACDEVSLKRFGVKDAASLPQELLYTVRNNELPLRLSPLTINKYLDPLRETFGDGEIAAANNRILSTVEGLVKIVEGVE
jgi:hypothetical protein